ncbi:hypothetical protein AU467_31335 [Mesorhizobium loti]|uniref:Uncharacterized protein n=1 Tax=Rhizobium loti TaxID=381 RepID=A0A117N1V5_RHILI|nr:hypothetical protein AU467_31335 [Mesorhizobium loti]
MSRIRELPPCLAFLILGNGILEVENDAICTALMGRLHKARNVRGNEEQGPAGYRIRAFNRWKGLSHGVASTVDFCEDNRSEFFGQVMR